MKWDIECLLVMFAEVHYHEADNTPIRGAAFKYILSDFFHACGHILKNHF